MVCQFIRINQIDTPKTTHTFAPTKKQFDYERLFYRRRI